MEPPTSDLADALLPLFPDFGPEGRFLVLPLFVLLGRGYPVGTAELAREAGRDEAAARRHLAGWRGLRRDGNGSIIGFGGLDLFPTRHHLRVGERDLFAWSAWDTLILPAILGEEASVASRCRTTDDDILLRVAPEGVLDCEPEDVRLGLRVPGRKAPGESPPGVEAGFLAGREAAAEWRAAYPDAHIFSLEEGFRLGLEVWTRLLGADLFPRQRGELGP
ncbi:organomercurial lyase [Thiohalorhabdus denitrificans]|uniref:Alkylmercury lyase n=1 Tax=Thiohalorhabdus denitrificans TaxID=381306 RepID=A0A1G5E6S9_9GAMM|nr:organomercurial lyase [Thiohalorhabdus denitrificans]SCY22410.1 alkylmercury lyase [Thiohalorhabdus denitrificans]